MRYKRLKLREIRQSNCVKYTNNRKKLEDNFISEGYKPKKGIITVGIDNKIINGNHRYCLLLQKYGSEHKIIVKKKIITYGIINFLTTTISILLLPIILPYFTIKDYFIKNEIK